MKYFRLSLLISFLMFLLLACSYEEEKPKPNIVIILADDMGFSDIGCFGSEIIKTPNLDNLASDGVIFSQFYNSARCCPSRASLLTGVYPHQAGMGSMTDQEISLNSYQGYLPDNVVTIPQILKSAGYRTYISGKWHIGDEPEHYPLNYGFDRCLALIQGASSYFEDLPYRNDEWPWGSTDNFHIIDSARFKYPSNKYATDLYTDYAIEFISEAQELEKPFFVYLAFTAPHWPLHALPEDIKKYENKFDIGWDSLRKMRYSNLIKLGIINDTVQLSQRDEDVKKWELMDQAERKEQAERMAVYAAMVDRLDQNVGRLINFLKKIGKYENTLIMFLSDNGGCRAEMVPYLSDNFSRGAEIGTPRSFTAYGKGWANVSNTPFRQYKAEVHEGGIATPFILSFPKINLPVKIFTTPAHLIDILPTVIDAAGVQYPEMHENKNIISAEGKNLFSLMQDITEDDRIIGFEHHGNSAVRKGKWKLVKLYAGNWELFDISSDRTETKNLIDQVDENLLKELFHDYNSWAERTGVYPRDVVVSRTKAKN